MSDQYVGEIRMFPGTYAPQGWALCNGQLLSISENEALFTLIGTTYGGDGQTTFALPNLQGRAPVHMGTNPATGTNYLLGQSAGTENVTLLTTQMPAHTHAVLAAQAAGDIANPSNNVWASNNVSAYAADPTGAVAMNPAAISPAGGGQPHDNMMPFTVINYIIALNGIYPDFNN